MSSGFTVTSSVAGKAEVESFQEDATIVGATLPPSLIIAAPKGGRDSPLQRTAKRTDTSSTPQKAILEWMWRVVRVDDALPLLPSIVPEELVGPRGCSAQVDVVGPDDGLLLLDEELPVAVQQPVRADKDDGAADVDGARFWYERRSTVDGSGEINAGCLPWRRRKSSAS